tara:strand:- start:1234 stop:1938 length:705 start_codon:yes stop_codon:yes gene_type:complete
MALPKLEQKTYTLTLPSTGESIQYRPFLVKEQKTLLLAQESKDNKELVNAVSSLINDCTFGKVNAKTCPLFDAEYIFLKVRAKSVGEKVDLVATCPDDGETKVNFVLDINDIEVQMTDDHTNIVEITDDVKIVFDYPILSSSARYANDQRADIMFDVVRDCVKEIHFGEESYNKVDMSKKDLDEFIDSLDAEQFSRVMDFFETMPKLRHVIEVVNPNTKVKSEILLEGLQNFLE